MAKRVDVLVLQVAADAAASRAAGLRIWVVGEGEGYGRRSAGVSVRAAGSLLETQ